MELSLTAYMMTFTYTVLRSHNFVPQIKKRQILLIAVHCIYMERKLLEEIQLLRGQDVNRYILSKIFVKIFVMSGDTFNHFI